MVRFECWHIAIDVQRECQQPGWILGHRLAVDIREIFDGVNGFYKEAGIRWNVVGPFFTKPTVPCGGTDLVCGEHKCRSSGYFVKYWGSYNKEMSKSGRQERSTNMFLNIPRELFKEGEYHFVYQKYMGWKSQGDVFGTFGSTDLRPSGSGRVSIATSGQWSNKFTPMPTKRPNTARCGVVPNCGIGLNYTTAHELGHLLFLKDTDAPSIMTSGGRSASSSKFSQNHIRIMQRNKGKVKLVGSHAVALSGTPRPGGEKWKRNTECNP